MVLIVLVLSTWIMLVLVGEKKGRAFVAGWVQRQAAGVLGGRGERQPQGAGGVEAPLGS